MFHEALRFVVSALCQGRSEADGLVWEPKVFHNSQSWLRIKAPAELTIEHADIIYMKVMGSSNIYFYFNTLLSTLTQQ